MIVDRGNYKVEFYNKSYKDFKLDIDYFYLKIDHKMRRLSEPELEEYFRYLIQNKCDEILKNEKENNIEVVISKLSVKKILSYIYKRYSKSNSYLFNLDFKFDIDFGNDTISFDNLTYDLNTGILDLNNLNYDKYNRISLEDRIIGYVIQNNLYNDNIYIKLANELIKLTNFTDNKKTINIKMQYSNYPTKLEPSNYLYDYCMRNKRLDLIEYIKYGNKIFKPNSQLLKECYELFFIEDRN